MNLCNFDLRTVYSILKEKLVCDSFDHTFAHVSDSDLNLDSDMPDSDPEELDYTLGLELGWPDSDSD